MELQKTGSGKAALVNGFDLEVGSGLGFLGGSFDLVCLPTCP